VKACPRCFSRIWDGAQHCDQCGAAVTVPAHVDAQGQAQKRRCPRCHERPDLEARLVGDVLLDECTHCHGVFVDRTTLERVLAERDQPSLAALGTGVAAAPASVTASAASPRPEETGRVYVPCPDCDAIMNRLNFGRRSGVIIDVCGAHGTWFDARELSRVVAFVESGGLDESRRKDLAQMKAEADLARVRASAQVVPHTSASWSGELRSSPLEELLRFLWNVFP
jgi:Zn-finger nucleic acid-binding protein